ncbi:M48 family metallopeptidase [Massilia sp. Root418]|uniref:M48 family metallopeptidase n=1 Tax=Massilia sp. Root418 TaxID=1736532 RepID=UPI000ADB97D0|nr:M48 family metallopeptidase [Massilia sp. Root418]
MGRGVGTERIRAARAGPVHHTRTSFNQQNQKAKAAGERVVAGPEYDRLNRISKRLQAQVPAFREDAAKWTWRLALIDAPVLNATCAPGGLVTMYSGLIRQLKLTDDKIAMVMGHEIAHALREHGRERLSQARAKGKAGQIALALAPGKSAQIDLADEVSHYLFTLPNSREHESEADRMGMELGARAGFNPRAAVSVWEKMAKLSKGSGPAEFLSTHPSDQTRIADLTAMLPKVAQLQPDGKQGKAAK